MKKKIVGLILIAVFLLSTVYPIVSLGYTQNVSKMNSNEYFENKKDVGTNKTSYQKNKETEENTENYTEEYKRWLELSDEDKAKCNIVPRKYNVSFDVLYEEETTKETGFFEKLKSLVGASKNEEIPEKFDLRDKIEIPIKNQGSYGLCGVFASVKSLETNLALNGYGKYDFSELHINYIESEEFGKGYILNSGGRDFYTLEDYLVNGYGPVLESEVPYDAKYTIDDYEYLLNLEKRAYVNNTMHFPTIDKKSEEYTTEELNSFRNKVKKHIIDNGSVYCTVCFSQEYDIAYNIIGGFVPKFSNGNWYLNYQGESKYADHAVSIIGWDDNFPKENFPEECRPKENGAYIAMNSWGESGMQCGVFYISYEDIFVEKDMHGIVSASTNIEDTLEKIKFEDVNFYNAIKEDLGGKIAKSNDKTLTIYISKLALDDIYYLNLENKNISNLKGIEKFTNLTTIKLADNNIENIEYLRNFNNDENFYDIDLKNNKIKDVSPLCNFEIINISNNPIATGLNNLKYVMELFIDDCELSDLQLEQITELSTISGLSLQNNNIEDVSCLERLKLSWLNLSENKNIKGIEKLINVDDIYLKNCDLDNSIINKLKELRNLKFLDLENNNITDVTGLNELKLWYLNLSGNKGIKLNTVPMNYEKLEDEYYYCEITGLYLNNCDIEDISELKNLNIDVISLQYNSISDVSPLSKISTLYLNGNKNLTNLDKLENVNFLYLEDCNINDFTFINNLKNLEGIVLCNNNIEQFPTIENETLGYIDLSNNEINDISNIESLLKVESDGISIDLSQNKIKQVPQLQKKVNIYVSKNYISDIPDNGNGYTLWEQQEISKNYALEINKENRIPMPPILKMECQNRYKNQTNFVTENCSIDYKRGEIIINPSQLGEGKASVTINSKSFRCKSDGTTFNISFEAKENINISCLELGNSQYKNVYIEGDEFDDSHLIVKAVYENGLEYEITDYEIINGQELNESQKNITIKYQGLELQVPINVFSKDNYDIIFGKKLLYDAIYELIHDGVRYKEDVNQDEVRCIIKKETIDKLTKLDLSNRDNIDNWKGLSSIYNLRDLDLSGNRIGIINKNKQEEVFSEICQLKQLEQLKLKNCFFDGTYFANEESIKEVLKLSNIKLIDFGEREITSHGYIEEKYCYLPKYLTKDDMQNIKIKYTYKNSKQEDVTEDMPLYVDENNYLYVVHDTEVTEDKIYGERIISIEICTEKIKQKINYYYEFDLKPTVLPSIEIKQYTLEGNIIKDVKERTSISEFKKNVTIKDNISYKIVSKEDKELKDTDIITTGSKIEINSDHNKTQYIICVTGDTTGDGYADIKDIFAINKHRLNKTKLENEYLQSADVNKDNKVDIKDIFQINKYRLGKTDLL